MLADVGRPQGADPCEQHYTVDDDGLKLLWSGTVFMNPPYDRAIGDWVAKARREVDEGHASAVFGLVPARTDTKWRHSSVAFCADAWLLRGRLKFGGMAGVPRHSRPRTSSGN